MAMERGITIQVDYQLSDQGQSLNMVAENANEQHATDIIQGVFIFLNGGSAVAPGGAAPIFESDDKVETVEAPKTEALASEPIKVESPVVKAVKEETVTPPQLERSDPDPNAKPKQEEAPYRPRALPYVNGIHTLTHSIGEQLGPAIGRDHDTGIKEYSGIKHYQTAYECTCGHKGRRYMREDSRYCKCHECHTKLRVRSATSVGFQSRDENGNYFVADAPFE